MEIDQERLTQIYGKDHAQRELIINKSINEFKEMFSLEPSIIFRSPARINLRGMHIDKHGGACNGVAIDRETFIFASPNSSSILYIKNPPHKEIKIDMNQSINTLDISKYNGWEKYAIASILAVKSEFSSNSFNVGFSAYITCDIPQGSGLSSSHAFIIALSCVIMEINGINYEGL